MGGIDELAEVISRIRDPELIRDLLVCILTERELREIDGRWDLVKLLNRGMSQRKVAEQLGMSLCKITRGSKELKKDNSALKRVIEEYLPLRETTWAGSGTTRS